MSTYYHDLLPPSPGSKTGRVWQLADEITRVKGRKASREEVMQAYRAEAGNPNTASTQYSRWNKFRARSGGDDAAKAMVASKSRPTSTTTLSIGADGRVVIPAEMRSAMRIGADGRVMARIVEGELRVMSPAVALLRAQELVRGAVPAGVSLADELVAERRAEAHRDDAS